jgi:hypothetical protein
MPTMRKPRRRTPRKPAKQQPAPLKQPPAPPPPPKKGWSIVGKLFAAALAAATLIGVPGALLTLLPRITVDGTGDFSKPASIAFVTTNTGSIPLRYPAIGMFGCEVSYIKEPDTPLRPCDLSRIPPNAANGKGLEWLDVDEKITSRLEDVAVVAGAPIVRANVIIIVGYYPWYFPVRFHKRFGFRSAKGSDGILYWRPYSL